MRIVRLIVAIVVGVIVGGATVFLIELASRTAMPVEALEGIDMTDSEALAAVMDEIPFMNKLSVVVSWLLGAFLAALVGSRLGRQAHVGWIAGGILVLATLANLLVLPHPAWMWVAGLGLTALATWLGAKVGAPTADLGGGVERPEGAS